MDKVMEKLNLTPETKIRIADSFNTLLAEHKKSGHIDTNRISDGYHTFGDLYNHRHELWITVCRLAAYNDVCDVKSIWRSKFHDDGSTYEGWFILGMELFGPASQMSYHLPNEKWESCNFAETLPKAPPFDGHTSDDVLQRLKQL
jgi:hypothetical protein